MITVVISFTTCSVVQICSISPLGSISLKSVSRGDDIVRILTLCFSKSKEIGFRPILIFVNGRKKQGKEISSDISIGEWTANGLNG